MTIGPASLGSFDFFISYHAAAKLATTISMSAANSDAKMRACPIIHAGAYRTSPRENPNRDTAQVSS
jgi:hypothetical protein